MAPLPPFLVRIAVTVLTQALTKQLATSPAFLRVVDRLIHQIDTLPDRAAGRTPPPYPGHAHDNYTGPSIMDRLKDPWGKQVEEANEPHDLESPFPLSQQQQKASEQQQHQQQTSSGTAPGARPRPAKAKAATGEGLGGAPSIEQQLRELQEQLRKQQGGGEAPK